jgi:hypothetical protein
VFPLLNATLTKKFQTSQFDGFKKKDLNMLIANQKMRASDVYEEIGLKIYRVLFKRTKTNLEPLKTITN